MKERREAEEGGKREREGGKPKNCRVERELFWEKTLRELKGKRERQNERKQSETVKKQKAKENNKHTIESAIERGKKT